LKATKINIEEILLFWKNRENEWIQYNKLRDDIKALLQQKNEEIPRQYRRKYREKTSERTIMRYLDALVKSGKLKKRIDSKHHTFYILKNRMALLKEILKKWVERQDNIEVLNVLSVFTLELGLKLWEQKKREDSLNMIYVLEETTKKVLQVLKAREMVYGLSSEKPTNILTLEQIEQKVGPQKVKEWKADFDKLESIVEKEVNAEFKKREKEEKD
jgi:hypothetical protein